MNNDENKTPSKEEMLDFYQKLRKKLNDSIDGENVQTDKKTIYSKFVSYLAALPDLFHLGIKLFFDGSVSAENKGALVAAIVYVISPIDLIPDSIPVAGWVDDLIVMTIGVFQDSCHHLLIY